ncbi:MAG: hypothetical protein L3K26_19335, partial [Candidatus Hydrogenedentes bacterium]|nr:hypothetical protein [Candidatus Hydrogenedentota bacterium]
MRLIFRYVAINSYLLLCLAAAAQSSPSSKNFLKHAFEVLPVEARYDYHQTLKEEPVHQPGLNVGAPTAENELAISPAGWSLLLDADAGPLARFSADDLRDFLNVSMGVSLPESTGLDGWKDRQQAIIAGTPAQLAGFGQTLKSSKDYEIRVEGDRIIVCGFDDAGVQHGLLNLEERLRLREGPYLPKDLNTVRHSLYQTRAVISWLGWMQWPDNFLAQLAHDGYDAIYASVYANPNGVKGPPHYDIIRTQKEGRLKDLIRRANARGIKVYCPILFANTGTPENEAELRELVRDIVTKFPEIHGY